LIISDINVGEKSFIGAYELKDTAVCDKLIDYWKNSIEKNPGASYGPDGKIGIYPDVKDSVDVAIPPNKINPIFVEYLEKLQIAVDLYIQQYKMSNWSSSWGITETSAIQYYAPGAGFKTWHYERGSGLLPVAARHIAWMTYLNDVEDGGGTEFYYQNVKFTAKKGRTLLWPADWTHTHKGIVSDTQEKYIITGWFNFISGNN